MDQAIIQVENLGKKYRIQHQQHNGMRYKTLRDVIADKAKRLLSLGERRAKSEEPPLSPLSPLPSPLSASEDFWALKNVSFEVKRGEVVGIIGRNGAGKSTLLKILSRITEPTEGRVRIKGRVASLLEVGTGFHPELTGRENIFLNGAILGMSRAEIRNKFDEIVAFAEVEKFLDTPVKHYSSGMYVRLAFAVAAHLEPEILIVDEVLAVGDAEFQKKCLGKMESVSRKEGRTVLFVSHNMGVMQMLCTRIAYLAQGKVRAIGKVDEQIGLYFQDIKRQENSIEKSVPLGASLELRHLVFSPRSVVTGNEIPFELELFSPTSARVSDLALLIYSVYGTRVAVMDLRHHGEPYLIKSGARSLRGRVRSLPLVEGDYHVGLYVKTADYHDNVLDLTTITVTNHQPANGVVPYSAAHRGFVELETILDR
jgi:lipopolysaccharide transport system ATP-binding protein